MKVFGPFFTFNSRKIIMSELAQENQLPLSRPAAPVQDFPPNLKYGRLAYGANILLHLRQREDLNLGSIGEKLQPILAGYRQVKPEMLEQFYEMCAGLLTQLAKYSDIAESCSKSGAYKDRRQEQLNVVLIAVSDIEKQPDILRMLAGMRRQ